MAKRKKQKFNNLDLIAIVLTVATLVMLFLPNLVYDFTVNVNLGGFGQYNGGEVEKINGIKAIFGFGPEDSETKYTLFSFLSLLAYLLPIGALVLTKLFKNKLGNILALACFAASAVFFFILPSFVVYAEDVVGVLAYQKVGATLGVGAIIAGILSSLNALLTLLKIAK